MNPAALIYSHTITPRLQYTVDFLSHYFGLHFKLTSSEDGYRSYDCRCKINYSYHRLEEGEIWIHSHVLLFETEERHVKVECFINNGYKAFFKTDGEVGFDILAGIFFLISRYEEYLPHQKDSYGRYAYENSVAYKESFLKQPLVNIWLEDLRKLLKLKNPEFAQVYNHFVFLPSYDIDMAWSYRNKGFFRNLGAMLALFVRGKWKTLGRRISVLQGRRQDPYDAYDWMDTLHMENDIHPLYFFLVAERTGTYDKNISRKNKEFVKLIQSLDEKYTIGLHPSWASGDEPELVADEKKWLEEVIKKPLEASRQHYIRFDVPMTYRHLLAEGISSDHSMGYGSINGFRASVATPYYWYDLKEEAATSLMVHPFCFMDANAYYEAKQTPEEAYQELMLLHDEVKAVNGTMITIWHNSFLGDDPEFSGWKEIYQQYVQNLEQKST
jgi:hypothetical protein